MAPCVVVAFWRGQRAGGPSGAGLRHSGGRPGGADCTHAVPGGRAGVHAWELAGLRKGERAAWAHDTFLQRPAAQRNAAWEADEVEAWVEVDVEGRLIKPWATGFVDWATNVVLGAAVTPRAPSRDSVLAALRAAIPAVDRGKNFLSTTVAAACAVFAVRVVNQPTPGTAVQKIYVRGSRHSRRRQLTYLLSRTNRHKRRGRVPPHRGEGAGPTPTRLGYLAVGRAQYVAVDSEVRQHPGIVSAGSGRNRRRSRCQVSGQRRRQECSSGVRGHEVAWVPGIVGPVRGNRYKGSQRKGRAVHRWIARRPPHVMGWTRTPQLPSKERWSPVTLMRSSHPKPERRAGADTANRRSCR
jgi:hypothetical protein